MKDHCVELGFRPDRLVVGGESAGGGLAVVLCMLARDWKKVDIAFQIPPAYTFVRDGEPLQEAARRFEEWFERTVLAV